MSDFDEDRNEDRIFRLEAGLILSTVRLRVLENQAAAAFESLGLKDENTSFSEVYRHQIDFAIRETIRHYADEDPDFAARLSRYFEKMKKRDKF